MPDDVQALAPSTGADVPFANPVRLLEALRGRGPRSRTELADDLNMAIPSVHRLVADLVDSDWVAATGALSGTGRGRPTTRFRFRDDRALLLAVDVGSASTRLALTSLDGVVLDRTTIETLRLRSKLSAGIGSAATRLRRSAGLSDRPFAAAAIGVPSVVDGTGRLTRPWREAGWAGVPLRAELSARLGCDVVVAQDNHFAALAEGSAAGTAPHATSLVVVELGIGVGAGYTVAGRIVSGSEGGLGRLTGWPCANPRGLHIGATLGELITVDGLLSQYAGRGGTRRLVNGLDLIDAAADGDRVAERVLRWAAAEFADTLRRIVLLLDPGVIVVGGGLGRGLFESGHLDSSRLADLPGTNDIRASVLGPDAVVTGAARAAHRLVPAWLSRQLAGLG